MVDTDSCGDGRELRPRIDDAAAQFACNNLVDDGDRYL
jgi:hypothetical protein